MRTQRAQAGDDASSGIFPLCVARLQLPTSARTGCLGPDTFLILIQLLCFCPGEKGAFDKAGTNY